MTDPQMPATNDHIFGFRQINIFSPQECRGIINSASENAWQAGTHSSGAGKNKKNVDDSGYRRVSMQPLSNSHDNWPLGKILERAREVNARDYQFDLTGFLPSIDFPTLLKYEAHNQGHYGWHLDICGGFATRKLTFTIQLSDPDEYDGCDLEFAPPQTFGFPPGTTFEDIRLALREPGNMVLFPSYLLHRVTPITRGTRYAIVGWIHGPTFK